MKCNRRKELNFIEKNASKGCECVPKFGPTAHRMSVLTLRSQLECYIQDEC